MPSGLNDVDTQPMSTRDSRKSAIEEMVRRGKAVYWKLPAPLRWLLSPVKAIYKLLGMIRPEVWIMTGSEVSSGRELGILFAGLEINKNYIRTLAFDDSCLEHHVGRKWLWAVRKVHQKQGHDCSLLVIEAPHCSGILSAKLNYLYIPAWVTGELDISAERSAIFRSRNKSLQSDLRRIRKNNLHFEVTASPSQLHNFYYTMYVPYTTGAHGDRSKIMTYGYVKAEFEKRGLFTDLLLVKENEECIAGVLLRCGKDKAKLSTLGVKDGNQDYVGHGAIGAVFYFAIQYLVDKGFTKIDLGGSRAFLKDGVLRYKRKWRQRISSKKGAAFLVKVLSQTQGLKGFLLNNPFIYKDTTGLKGAAFLEGDKSLLERDFSDIYKRLYVEGLSKLVIYRFGHAAGGTADPVPPEFSDRMEVSSAESLLRTMR